MTPEADCTLKKNGGQHLGLPKTQLEHNIAAAAINMIRMDAYWTGHPLDRTRSSHLARLDFSLTA